MRQSSIAPNRPTRHPQYLLAACLLAAAFPLTAPADTLNYIGLDNSFFNNTGGWNPNKVPVNGDTANLGVNSIPGFTAGDLHVTYNYVVTGLTAMTFDSSALPGAFIINVTGGTLGATTETFSGSAANNAFNLANGAANTVATLNLAGTSTSNDLYTVASTGTTLTVTDTLYLGLAGTGVLTQTDGIVNIHNSTASAFLQIGVDSSGNGTYNLNGGALTVDLLRIGQTGTAVFNQTAGSLTVNGNAIVSNGANSAPATYNYSGGSGTFTGGLSVGIKGTFNLQTGGVLPFNVTVNSNGTFNFAGGSLGGGIFLLQGGTVQTLGHSLTLSQLGSSGTIQNGSPTTASIITVSPASDIAFAGHIVDGAAATLGLIVSGHTLTLSGSNTYSGTTTVQTNADLKAGANSTISPNSPINLTGGILDLQNFSASIPSLSGTTGSAVLVATTGVLTVGSSAPNSTFVGTFIGGGELLKTGSNTLTLSCLNPSPFNGFIVVQDGTLAAGVTNGIPVGVSVELTNPAASLSIPFNQHIATLSTDNNNSIVLADSAVLSVGSANVDSTLSGNFSGTGVLVKNGTANLTIGHGSADTNANTDSSLTVTVNAGTLTLDKAPATIAVAGDLYINAGTVILDAFNQIASTSFVEIDGGTLNLSGYNQLIGALNGTSGSMNANAGTLTVAQTANTSYSGTLLGSGHFIKSLGGTLQLNNVASYTGTISATDGALTLGGTVAASSLSASNGAVLQFTGTALTTPATVNAIGGSINQLGTATMTIGASSGGASTITIGPGSASTFTTGSGLTSINATGTINQSDGTFNANGNITVTAGSYTQTGGTFTWANNKTMLIQSAGKVTLLGYYQTPNGATINVDGMNSQFNIAGTGSAYLTVAGNSTVGVTSGASVHTDLYFFIGTTDGPGTITVDGPNSSITSSALASYGENNLGTNGTGFLTLSSAATGNVPNGFRLGNAGSSSGTLSVQSSAILTTGPLDVGTIPTNLTATLSVIGGTITQTGNATLAIGASSASTATVTIGPSGTLTTGTGNITLNPTGTFTLQAGGTLNINGNFTNSGSLTLAGNQSWAANTTFTNNAGIATFSTDAGSVSASPLSIVLNAGTLLLNGPQHLHSLTINGGTLGGYNTTSLSLTIGTNPYTLAPSATLPAYSVGGMSLHTLTTSAKTTLAFNLVTPGNGGDRFTVFDFQGLTLNGGTIAIANSATGASSLGYYKAILYISSIQGAGISSLTLPPITNNVSYTLDTQHDPGYVDIHRGFLGDANDNGIVNFDDFLILSQNFGQAGGWSQANFLGDPTVDFNDFLLLSQHFGQSILAGSSTATADELAAFQSASVQFFAGAGVPEPASLALLGIGAASLLVRRRR